MRDSGDHKRKREDKEEDRKRKREEGMEVELEVPYIHIELVEMIFGYLPMKEVIHSASLTCKPWHRLVQESDALWSIFFRLDVVELHNPFPYWPPDDETMGEDSTKSWRERCRAVFTQVRSLEDADSRLGWALDRGYLGLARLLLKRMPPYPIGDRDNSILTRVDFKDRHAEVVNSIRCLVALGYSLRTPENAVADWKYGGLLHIAASVVNTRVLECLVVECCSQELAEDIRMDINEVCVDDGFTPLHCLFEIPSTKREENLLDPLRFMLRHGANPKLLNKAGKDCIEFATSQGFLQCAKMMSQREY